MSFARASREGKRTMNQFDAGQRTEVIKAAEKVAGADADAELVAIEQLLWSAIDATDVGYRLWEAEGEERFGDDLLMIPAEEVDGMDDEWKLAYVGHLLRSLAILYGVNDGRTLEARPGSIAELLRKLNDIRQSSRRLGWPADRDGPGAACSEMLRIPWR